MTSTSSTAPSGDENNGKDKHQKKSGNSSSTVSRKSSSKSSSKKTSQSNIYKREESQNFHAAGIGIGTPTPSQRRKIVFYERVQKYINQKRQRKHSLDLLSDDEPRTRRSISAGDLLDAEYMRMQANANQRTAGNKRKAKSFKISSSTNTSQPTKMNSKNSAKKADNKLQDVSNNENAENSDHDEGSSDRDALLLFRGRRERASTLGDLGELPMKVSNKHPSWLELNQEPCEHSDKELECQRSSSNPDEQNTNGTTMQPINNSPILLASSSYLGNQSGLNAASYGNGSTYTIIDVPGDKHSGKIY